MPSLADYKAPYPSAPAGMKRCVIYLDPKDENDELSHLKIELIPGRVVYCEDPKRNFISGSIEEQTIDGWGYDYYTVHMGNVVDKHGNEVTTRNSVNFVPLVGTGPHYRYNSKLPIVVYVPHDAELRYRVWSDETVRASDRNSFTSRGALSETTAPPPVEKQEKEVKERARAVQSAQPQRSRAVQPISSAYAETGLSSIEVSPSRHPRGSTSSAPFTKSRSAAAPTSITSREAAAPTQAQAPNGERGSEAVPQHASASRHRSSAKGASNVEESPSRSNRGDSGKSPRRGTAEGAGEGEHARHHSVPRGDKTLYDRMSPRRSSAVEEPLQVEEKDDGKKHRSLINRMRKKSSSNPNSNTNSPHRSHRNYDNEL